MTYLDLALREGRDAKAGACCPACERPAPVARVPCWARRAPAARARASLLWALGDDALKMLIIASTLICINHANQVAVGHCCGLGESRAALTTSRWAGTAFIHCNKWFRCGALGKQLLVVSGCR